MLVAKHEEDGVDLYEIEGSMLSEQDPAWVALKRNGFSPRHTSIACPGPSSTIAHHKVLALTLPVPWNLKRIQHTSQDLGKYRSLLRPGRNRLWFSSEWSPEDHQMRIPAIDDRVATTSTLKLLADDLRAMLIAGKLRRGDLVRCAESFEACLEWNGSAIVDMVAMTTAATLAPIAGTVFRQRIGSRMQKYGLRERFTDFGKDAISRIGDGGLPGPSRILSALHKCVHAIQKTGRTEYFRSFRDISEKLALRDACNFGSASRTEWTWLIDPLADRACRYLAQERWSLGQLKTLITRGFRYRSCFISYAHQDGVLANQIADSLRESGVRCWLDREQLAPGQVLPKRIRRAINSCECVLALITPASYQSRWVALEVSFALGERTMEDGVLIPVCCGVAYEPSRFAHIDEQLLLRRLESIVAQQIAGETPSQEEVDQILLGLQEAEQQEEPTGKQTHAATQPPWQLMRGSVS